MTGEEYEVFTKTAYQLTESNDVDIQELDGDQQFSYLAPKGYRNDHAVFESEIQEDQDLYIRIQASYVQKVSVYINGELKAYKDLSSSFYHVGDVKKGDVVMIVLPMILTIVFGGAFGSEATQYGPKILGIDTVVPVNVVFLLANTGLMGVPITVLEVKDQGVLKRYITYPVSYGMDARRML